MMEIKKINVCSKTICSPAPILTLLIILIIVSAIDNSHQYHIAYGQIPGLGGEEEEEEEEEENGEDGEDGEDGGGIGGLTGGEGGGLGGGLCLIATAAFGSELSPQVQFLRDFRDNYILSTAAGTSFMNVFNTWYYSFSPSIAEYERQQPWLQQTVRVLIYPLLGILNISEKAYSSISGELGALTAGAIASSMIGAVYFWPLSVLVLLFVKRKDRDKIRIDPKNAHSFKRYIEFSTFDYRLGLMIISLIILVTTVFSIIFASTNQTILMVTTSLFVLIVLSISAILSGKVFIYATVKMIEKIKQV